MPALPAAQILNHVLGIADFFAVSNISGMVK
jgi:hypothetical protein